MDINVPVIQREYTPTTLTPLGTAEECFQLGFLIGMYTCCPADLAEQAYGQLEMYEASLMSKYGQATIN